MKKIDFWKEQLNHAHARHRLQDQFRFSTFRILLGIHGLVVAALVFKRLEGEPSPRPDDSLAIGMPVGLFLVSFAIYCVYLVREKY